MSFQPRDRSAQENQLTANDEMRFNKFVDQYFGVIARFEP
jgi:hypothetical protein